MIVGHEEILGNWEKSIPRVSLFVGPRSVGKWTTAEYIRNALGITEADVLRISTLTMVAARTVVRFVKTAPVNARSGKLAIVRLDGASDAATVVLLEALEELKAYAKVILVASTFPPPTVTSRSMVFNFGLLSQSEIIEILTRRKLGVAEATRYAELSGGTVKGALDAAMGNAEKNDVLLALRAITGREASLLEKLADRWTEAHTDLLVAWCIESITTRWKLFTEAEVEVPGTKLQIKILMALRAKVRPRLIVRASLMSVLRGN